MLFKQLIVLYIEDITWPCKDTKFLFACWKIKISKDSPKFVWRPDKHFWLEHFLKICEDDQRLPKTSEEDPKMFWSYTNKFKRSQRDKNDIKNDITHMWIKMISSHVGYCFYQFATNCYTTNFYIIKYSNHHLFHVHQQEVALGQLTGTHHTL